LPTKGRKKKKRAFTSADERRKKKGEEKKVSGRRPMPEQVGKGKNGKKPVPLHAKRGGGREAGSLPFEPSLRGGGKKGEVSLSGRKKKKRVFTNSGRKIPTA